MCFYTHSRFCIIAVLGKEDAVCELYPNHCYIYVSQKDILQGCHNEFINVTKQFNL